MVVDFNYSFFQEAPKLLAHYSQTILYPGENICFFTTYYSLNQLCHIFVFTAEHLQNCNVDPISRALYAHILMEITVLPLSHFLTVTSSLRLKQEVFSSVQQVDCP